MDAGPMLVKLLEQHGLTLMHVDVSPMEVVTAWYYVHQHCGYSFRCVDKPVDVSTFRCPRCSILR